MEGFKRGIPPTVPMLMKKNTILTNIRQNPMEYMSFLLNRMIFSVALFKKNFGITAEPIKNATNPMAIVTVKLGVSVFNDSIRNIEKRKMTINGLKMWFFKMLFLFKKLKKSAPGYNFLKKLFTHWSSTNPRMANIVVNKKDL